MQAIPLFLAKEMDFIAGNLLNPLSGLCCMNWDRFALEFQQVIHLLQAISFQVDKDTLRSHLDKILK